MVKWWKEGVQPERVDVVELIAQMRSDIAVLKERVDRLENKDA